MEAAVFLLTSDKARNPADRSDRPRYIPSLRWWIGGIPFIAADLGNFFAGSVSGVLIRRGWPLGAARKALVVFGGIGVTLLIPTIFTTNSAVIALLFGLATFSYASFSTIANVLPSDLYHTDSVASVSGMSGTSAGLGTIVAFELIGHLPMHGSP